MDVSNNSRRQNLIDIRHYFPKSNRPNPKKDQPGPGAYEPNKSTMSNANVIIGGKTENDKMFSIKEVDQPGPGAYEQKIIKENTPQYTFGSKHKAYVKDVPGPGSYEAKQSVSVRSGAFGTQKRDTIKQIASNTDNLQMPGPGAYGNDGGMGSKSKRGNQSVAYDGAATRGLSTLNKEQLNNPGPGMYQANSNFLKSKTPTIGFGTQKRPNHLVKNQEAPGPGNYNVDSRKDAGFKMGQKLNTRLNENPGPGSYEPSSNQARTGSQTFRMSQSARKSEFLTNRSTSDLPGPGNYNQGYKEFGRGVPSVKIGIKTKDLSKLDVPGPGSYDTKNSQVKPQTSQSIRFNNSIRQDIVRKEDLEKPGPGNYNQKSAFAGEKGFTMGAKKQPKYSDVPGPGSYDTKNDLTKAGQQSQRIATTKRKTFMEEAPNDLPGPGNYDQGSAFANSKGFTIGAKKDQKYSDVPGPGSYNAKDELTKYGGQSQRIATTKRKTFMEEVPNEMPGPGNYDQGSTFQNGKGFKIGTRQDPKFSDVPGPGSYDTKNDLTKAGQQSQRIATTERKTFMQDAPNDMPGPGNYDQGSTFQNGKGFKIGTRQDPKYSDVPGPGSYDVKDDAVKSGAMSQRLTSAKRTTFMEEAPNDLPGPGNYDQQSAFQNSKGFTIGMRKDPKYSDVPGPGSYDVKDEVIKSGQMSQRLTSAKRTTFMEDAPNDLPGPGNYDQGSTFGNGKAFTIQGRPDPKYNDIPGPGTYNNEKQDILRPGQHSQRLASGKRTTFAQEINDQNPGPGGYMLGSTLDSKGFTIQGKHPYKQDEYPGPGHYDPYDEDNIPVPKNISSPNKLSNFAQQQMSQGRPDGKSSSQRSPNQSVRQTNNGSILSNGKSQNLNSDLKVKMNAGASTGSQQNLAKLSGQVQVSSQKSLNKISSVKYQQDQEDGGYNNAGVSTGTISAQRTITVQKQVSVKQEVYYQETRQVHQYQEEYYEEEEDQQ
eukprot:403343924